jgi:hypothetical protein
MATVEEILQADSWNPTFAFRPGFKKPFPSDITFDRGSAAWTLNQNRDVVKRVSGEERLFGPRQALRIEGQKTQRFSSPTDFAGWGGRNYTVGADVTDKEITGHKVKESSDSSDKFHFARQGISLNVDQAASLSWILKPRGRDYIRLELIDTAGNATRKYFHVANGTVGSGSSTNGIIDAGIRDIGGGIHRARLIANPTAGASWNAVQLLFADVDGDSTYTGDGRTVAHHYHAQAEGAETVTTPILDGGATRNAESVEIPISDWNDEEGTLLFTFKIHSSTMRGFGWLFSDKGSNDEVVTTGKSGLSSQRLRYREGVNYNDVAAPTGTLSEFMTQKVAVSIDGVDVRMGVNGTVDVGRNADVNILSAFTKLDINKRKNWPFDLISLGYQPEALSTTDLETLTTVV